MSYSFPKTRPLAPSLARPVEKRWINRLNHTHRHRLTESHHTTSTRPPTRSPTTRWSFATHAHIHVPQPVMANTIQTNPITHPFTHAPEPLLDLAALPPLLHCNQLILSAQYSLATFSRIAPFRRHYAAHRIHIALQ